MVKGDGKVQLRWARRSNNGLVGLKLLLGAIGGVEVLWA